MQPKTFQELKDQIQNGQFDNQRRSFGDQSLYNQYMQCVPNNIKDHILEIQILENQNEFGINTSGFTVNLFCYRLKLKHLPLVKHCNLWFDDWDISSEDLETQTNAWLKAVYGCVLEYCYFVNEPKNRSIAHKPHAHVFVNFENYKQ